MMAGDGAHSISAQDVHLSGEWLVSSGMDNAVKIWPLKTERIQNAVAGAP